MVKNQVVIAGGGRVGEEIARILAEREEEFTIVEINPLKVDRLKEKKYNIIQGNVEEEETLIEAGIKNARKFIITLPKAETNISIISTAKELNKTMEINARAEHSDFIEKLKKAGANLVIVPEVVAGNELI